MNREQRHTVHYLAARAKNGDEWARALLQRLSTLAQGGTARGTASSLPAEGLGEGTAATTHPRTSSASMPNPSHLACAPVPSGCAAAESAVPATALSALSQTNQRSGSHDH